MSDREYIPTRSQAYEESENEGRNGSDNPTMGEVIAARFNRRDILRGALAATAISATVSPLALAAAGKARAAGGTSAFNFKEVAAGVDEKHHVPEGYDADILIRWGDAVEKGAPAFDPMKQTAAAQAKQFGYNNDYVGYVPMQGAANPSEHGLLVVNHEYTSEELMFPGLKGAQDTKEAAFQQMTKALVDIEMMAHGGSVLEIRKTNGKWQVVRRFPLCPPHHRRDRVRHLGSGRRPRPHEDLVRPGRPEGPRHAEQLRRRRHALGHLAHLRGELQRLFRGQAPGRASGSREREALRGPEQLVQLGPVLRPLRRLEGAERAQPVRLGGRDRPVRSQLPCR